MASGLHHQHIRKRIYKKYEKYPHPNKFKRFVDKTIYIIAIFGPLIALPQIIKIWYYKDAGGVSPLTWIGYFLGAFLWMTYGIMHKEKPIIIANIMWIIATISIITGSFIY